MRVWNYAIDMWFYTIGVYGYVENVSKSCPKCGVNLMSIMVSKTGVENVSKTGVEFCQKGVSGVRQKPCTNSVKKCHFRHTRDLSKSVDFGQLTPPKLATPRYPKKPQTWVPPRTSTWPLTNPACLTPKVTPKMTPSEMTP